MVTQPHPTHSPRTPEVIAFIDNINRELTLIKLALEYLGKLDEESRRNNRHITIQTVELENLSEAIFTAVENIERVMK